MQSATSWHCGGKEKCSVSWRAAPILSSRFWCFRKLKEQGPMGGATQPSDGWASSMYTNRKSATSLKSSTNCRKAGRWLMKGGQVAEPKLTTRGRSDDSKSRSLHSPPFWILMVLLHRGPSGTFTTLELGASQPSFTWRGKIEMNTWCRRCAHEEEGELGFAFVLFLAYWAWYSSTVAIAKHLTLCFQYGVIIMSTTHTQRQQQSPERAS